MMQKVMRIFSLFMLMMLLTACSIFDLNLQPPSGEAVRPVPTAILDQEEVILPYELLISQADAVFLGRVSYISATQSVADSMEMTHQISFAVAQAGTDTIGIGTGVVMTVLGQSPVDDILVVGDGTLLQGTAVHQLQVGDEVVVFAKQVQLTSDSVTKAVLMPIPDLTQLFLTAAHWDRVYTAATISQANTH
jgi:hypothetical protein